MPIAAPVRFAGFLLILFSCFSLPARAAKYKIAILAWDTESGEGTSIKKAIEKASHGDIEVVAQNDKWKDSYEYESSAEALQMVIDGKAQIGHTYVDTVGALNHRFWIFESPYLVRGYRHMEGVIDGPIGADLLKSLGDQGLVGLEFSYNGGLTSIASKDRPIRRPEDLKGMKVGVHADGVAAAWLRSLGATPVLVQHGSEPRDGSLDGLVVTWRNFRAAKLDRAFKYFSVPDSGALLRVTYINKKFYESLPEADRAVLVSVLQEAARAERAKAIGLNEEGKRVMLSQGIREVHLTASEKKAFREALRPAYRDSIAPLVGQDLLDRVRKQGDGTIHYQLPSDFAER